MKRNWLAQPYSLVILKYIFFVVYYRYYVVEVGIFFFVSASVVLQISCFVIVTTYFFVYFVVVLSSYCFVTNVNCTNHKQSLIYSPEEEEGSYKMRKRENAKVRK